MGSGLEYGPRRMQGRMQGQARDWQGRVGLAAGLAVGLAGPPAKPGGGPCETDHKSITAALPVVACNSADSSPTGTCGFAPGGCGFEPLLD